MKKVVTRSAASPNKRCSWVNVDDPLLLEYHDREWGVPVHSDPKHFEVLVLSGAQARLNWSLVLKKREGYRRAFDSFDPERVNANGNGATFNLSNGLMYVFGVGGVSRHGIQTMNWHNFAPRASFAYQVNPKIVVRAGYGWGYDLGVFGSNFGHSVTQNVPVLLYQNNTNATAPFAKVFNLAQGPSAPSAFTVGSNGTFPLPADVNPTFRPATVTLPTTYLYNAAVQYQVSSKIAVTGAYVGNSNRHGFLGQNQTVNPDEPMFVPGSRPVRPLSGILPFGNDLQYYCNCSNEHYDSFEGQVKTNAWHSWTLEGSYIYQTQWGPGWDHYDPNYYFLYNRRAGEGYGNSLPHNQITITQTYDIPFGRGRKYAQI